MAQVILSMLNSEDIIFRGGASGNTEAMRIIGSDGDVGINRTSPAAKLHAEGDAASLAFRVTGGDTGGNQNMVLFEDQAGIKFVVQMDGDTGVGTSSPSARLHVSNDAVSDDTDVFRVQSGLAGSIFAVSANGKVEATPTSWGSSSTQDVGIGATSGLTEFQKFTSS